jgi:hypothetical protein
LFSCFCRQSRPFDFRTSSPTTMYHDLKRTGHGDSLY